VLAFVGADAAPGRGPVRLAHRPPAALGSRVRRRRRRRDRGDDRPPARSAYAASASGYAGQPMGPRPRTPSTTTRSRADPAGAMTPRGAGPQAAHLGTRPAAPRARRSAGGAARSGVLHRLQHRRHLDPARRRDRPRRAPGGLVASRGHEETGLAIEVRASSESRRGTSPGLAARGDRGLPRVAPGVRRRGQLAVGRAPVVEVDGTTDAVAWLRVDDVRAGRVRAAAVVIEALGWTDAPRP
jgi:hypothetical protein